MNNTFRIRLLCALWHLASCAEPGQNPAPDSDTLHPSGVDTATAPAPEASIPSARTHSAEAAGLFATPETARGVPLKLYLDSAGWYLWQGPGRTTRQPLGAQGRWQQQGDTVVLQTGTARPQTWVYRRNALHALHGGATLQRQPEIYQRPAWVERRRQGYELFAVGNEPFWNLAVDLQGRSVFRTADGDSAVFQPVGVEVSGDRLLFRASGRRRLHARLSRGFCSDGMSDFIYLYSVTVTVDSTTYQGCAHLFDAALAGKLETKQR